MPVADLLAAPGDLDIAQFDYDLPSELIAQTPLTPRDSSRLMVLDRISGAIGHSVFRELDDWLAPGDLLVANNSRVIPARLRGVRTVTSGAVEVLLLRASEGIWSALGKPAKRLKEGTQLTFPSRLPGFASATAVIEANLGDGELRMRFQNGADEHLDAYGATPLPPYITQPLADNDRYQTVYGTTPGSAAAPTAGLHFTRELIDCLRRKNIDWAEVTLHVGLDTFRPVTEERVQDHRIHREWCQVPRETARAIASCRQRGGRVVAVGTTAARTLETIGADWRDDRPRGFAGMTDTFIVPGHRWRLVDALVTNFHLPQSTLIMLVSAFAGRESILHAYGEAVRYGYRFYSFGDAMLIC
ncbi:MAG: tRNA preQ1(34) S-adenosylmethionine ribosyltransferase-isomerase QueA [Thermomicrobiales bacterium]